MYRRKRKGNNNKEKKRHEKTQQVFEGESQKETLRDRPDLNRETVRRREKKEEEMMNLGTWQSLYFIVLASHVTLEIDLVCHHYRAISIHCNLEMIMKTAKLRLISYNYIAQDIATHCYNNFGRVKGKENTDTGIYNAIDGQKLHYTNTDKHASYMSFEVHPSSCITAHCRPNSTEPTWYC